MPTGSSDAITWIHLSDFHAGQEGTSVWHQVDTELERNVAGMAELLGVPDLVLFTGDLATRGGEEEYGQVDQLLARLERWLGKELPVFAVPGNHDVVRPAPDDAWQYAAFESYEQQPGLRKALWEGTKPLLQPLFPHYDRWMRRRVVTSLEKAGWQPHVSPRVPGDLSVMVEKSGMRLGLVGLNSAWTHLSDAAEGRIQLPVEQLGLALPPAESSNRLDWFKQLDAAFLLTHHPHGWLSEKARETYRAEIHPPGRFALALFGHMHEPRSEVVSSSGTQPRAFFQAPSLFGLERYGQANESRVMGYAWGRVTTTGEVRVWPQRRVRRGDGGHAFDRDQSFEETDDGLGGVVLVPGRVCGDEWQSGNGRAVPVGNRRTVPETEHVGHTELNRYLAKIESLHRELRLAGFETKIRVPIGLEELYEPLDAVLNPSVQREQVFRTSGEAEGHDARIELARAFVIAGERGMRGMVLLGDPGSGKTTHLKQVLLKVVRDGAESIGLPAGTVPVFLPLRRLRELEAGLPGFIEQELRDPLLDVDEGFGQRLCKRGRLLFLLDGLDEVANAEDRERVARWIEAARRASPNNYFLVSCRFSGYALDAQLDEGFLELHLRPMNPVQVESFVRKWYEIVERATHSDPTQARVKAEAGADDLLATLRKPEMRSARVYTMTHNPLLLTTICLVHRDRGTLPDQRVVLYEEAVSVLLERWRRVTKELNVTFPAREALQVLMPVAGWMHQSIGRIRASLQDLEPAVASGLETIGRTDVAARTFLETIRDESGLLTGWGVNEFGFMHLGFQEYLAARSLQARASDDPGLLSWLAGRFDYSWWQEVILLMLAQDHPPMFRRFMSELVKRPEFPQWARSEMMGLCWNEAFGVSKEPFVALLRENGGGETLGARQLAAAELLSRRMPAVLEELGELLRTHPASEVRHWWLARTRQPVALETKVVAGVELVLVPGGRFSMGSPDDDELGEPEERPQHSVELSSFWLARTPVTNAQYREFLRANPDVREPRFWGNRRYNRDEQPVVGVSWYDAKTYCDRTGLVLPTEAQWEYACRAGTTTRYCTGDREEDLACVGWYRGNSDERVHAVAELEPNAWGLYDMHGNVREWCKDEWRSTYERIAHRPGDGLRVDIDPLNNVRVVRGGIYKFEAHLARSAARSGDPSRGSWGSVGMRPAQVALG